MEMPEWENKKFEGLLTSNIWHSNYNEIKSILSMEEFLNTDHYIHLLVPPVLVIC